MNAEGILSLVDELDDEVDNLEDSLKPLIEHALSDTAAKLPLLDRAKLYILVTYAIESILFSYLRLNGVKAREHPVFRELSRVKQYFEKIKAVEVPAGNKPNLSLDKEAAQRFINAGLSGNDRLDTERAERLAKEKAQALLKSRTIPTNRQAHTQAVASEELPSDSPRGSSSDTTSSSDDAPAIAVPPHAKSKKDTESQEQTRKDDVRPKSEQQAKSKKRKSRRKRKRPSGMTQKATADS